MSDKDSYLYGIDMEKEVTPIQARDAIVQCFISAHANELEDLKNFGSTSEEEFEKIKALDIKTLIEKFFKETEGDFENPTKTSLIRVIDKLAEFAKNFRNQEVVKKHYEEIMQIINKLP